MKNCFYIFVALLVSTLTYGCVNSDELDYDGPRTEITVHLNTPSKTSLGEKGDDGVYPIFWSATDRIVMNGVVSDVVKINAENNSRALFSFKGVIDGERYITFPYTEGSSCTAEQPTVVFSATQNYVAGSFDINAAPMCGYSVDGEGVTTLKHLAGVLRLPFKANMENTTLKQLTITATTEGAALAGEYSVDCQSGDITAIEGATSETILYTFGEKGLPLSTTEATPLYIALPKGSFGSCVIAVTDSNGFTMMLKWTGNNIKPGVVREIKDITYRAGLAINIDSMDCEQDDIYTETDNNIEDMIIGEDDILINYIPGQLFGYVKDNSGNPLKGVTVTDGIKVATTDANGRYQMAYDKDAYYIFYIVPEAYEITKDEYGRPGYFQRINPFHSRYDFTLKPLAGGVENEFLLFGFADPQCGSDTAVERFKAQVAPEVKGYAKSQSIPCYGITLGDIISMGGSTNEEYMFYDMRDAMHADKMGMPVFQVMGNHDNCFMNAANPVVPNTYSSNFNLRIQRPFEDALGPVNFAFNRGSVHIVGMRNMQWKTNDNCATANTTTCFTKEQYDWLKAELALVPKTKMVVLCVHIPLYNSGTTGDGTYRQEVLSLLDQFAEAHVISGHLHYQHNYDHTQLSTSSHKIYEHAQAAVNGASWSSNINGDGVPNGYAVYHAKGATFKDWYWKSYAEGMTDRNYQIRLYRGNAVTGAETPADAAANPSGTMGYYKFGYASNVLLANVFNSDKYWTVEVYENGTKTGNMTSLVDYHAAVPYDDLSGEGTSSSPWYAAGECGRDFWAIGLLCGYLGKNSGGLFYKHCYQLWKYTLKNANATIKVVATDRKGNKYECSTITDGRDYTYALYTGTQGDDATTDDETFGEAGE